MVFTPAQWTPAMSCPWDSQALFSVQGTPKPILGVLCPPWWWQWLRDAQSQPGNSPKMQMPTHPTEGLSRDLGCSVGGHPLSSHLHPTWDRICDNGSSCAAIESSSGIKLCQNHPEIRAGNKSQVQTKSWLEAAFPQVPDCPLLLLGAMGTPQGAWLSQPHCHMPPASSAEVL